MSGKSKTPLYVVLCWHMHQPDYRDHLSGTFQQPWVYLHGIKDYVDMVAYLERAPEARAVFNFSPILLEQLADYEQQLQDYLSSRQPIRDPLLAALDMPAFPADAEHRLALIRACLRANRERQIDRFPAYRRLVHIAELAMPDIAAVAYLSNQFLADLVTWYHLAWLGETVRHENETARRLMEQGEGFTLHQRHELLQLIARLLGDLHRRYRQLAVSGQIELSMSPYAHPMLPLLLDFAAAREVLPETELPVLQQYPGGEASVEWHLRHGLRVFENYFGIHPAGCWPSEGGVSKASLGHIRSAGFRWAATGEGVIRNSLRQSSGNGEEEPLHCSYRPADLDLHLFARDDHLSDLIGFTYRDWHADDAVADLVHRLEQHAGNLPPGSVVSVIMDGENAWEYYPENGYYFLSALYKHLAGHPDLCLTTYADILDKVAVYPLPDVVAGSWVYGSFSTWIGDPDKNRGWDILGDVKRVYDEITGHNELNAATRDRVEQQLAACEGSDWFWWFGDYNPADTVSDFERLFRLHVANLYQMLGQEPPQYLSQTFTQGTGTPALRGVMRPGTFHYE